MRAFLLDASVPCQPVCIFAGGVDAAIAAHLADEVSLDGPVLSPRTNRLRELLAN